MLQWLTNTSLPFMTQFTVFPGLWVTLHDGAHLDETIFPFTSCVCVCVYTCITYVMRTLHRFFPFGDKKQFLINHNICG